MRRFSNFTSAQRWAGAVALLGAIFSASIVRADVLIGNMPSANGSAQNAFIANDTDHFGSPRYYSVAVSFTTPAQAYSLDNVKLYLGFYQSGDVPEIGIYNDNSNKPGSIVGSLLSNPPNGGTNYSTFTFTPTGAFPLNTSTKYWLKVAMAQSTDLEYQWSGANPGVNPTGLATFGSYADSTNGTSWFNGLTERYAFEINATAAVPEPATGVLVVIGAGVASIARRRRT